MNKLQVLEPGSTLFWIPRLDRSMRKWTSSQPDRAVDSMIDGLCDHFEESLRLEHRPQIEEFLDQAPEPDRPSLLAELILLELEYLADQPSAPTIEGYQRRFPQYAGLILEVCAKQTLARDSDVTPDPTRFPARPKPAKGSCSQPLTGHAATLAEVWPFSELSRTVIREIADAVREQEYEAGAALIVQGEPPRHLIVVLAGEAEVRLRSDGQSHRVAAVGGESQIVGEMSLLTAEPATASVIATTAVRALVLPAEEFYRLAQRHHLLWLALNRLVAERLGRNVVDVLVGKTLEGYQIVRCVGRGGMAVVYEARAVDSGRTVALKMMSHRFTHDLEAQGRFEREMEICQSLDHPGIAQTFDRFTAFGTNFMVMEFCAGVTLSDLIRRHGLLPLPQVRRIAGQLAGALAFAHRAGICHRDIKPSNVMIGSDGIVKLMDFGLAKTNCSVDLTGQGHILGTLRYMPPEQLTGDGVDYHADIFSFGCLVFEMITGRPVFRGSDMLEILAEHLNWSLPPADELRPHLDADLYDVLRTTLAKDPAQRRLELNRLAAWATPVDAAWLAGQSGE